jgi:hypothetical protein
VKNKGVYFKNLKFSQNGYGIDAGNGGSLSTPTALVPAARLEKKI